jgi:hypothetical protein
MLFGEGGFVTKTFAYLRHVLTAALDLIAELRRTIASLVQNLCAADARNTDLEAQNKSLVEQLRLNNEKCDALAQRCQLAEEKNDLLNLTATTANKVARGAEREAQEGGYGSLGAVHPRDR